MEIYFDNSATTVCTPQVCKAVTDAMTRNYGNPSSVHRKGLEAEKTIREAKETIARTLRCDAKEIYLTSGGTESDNWALIGSAYANRRKGNHLITTAVEHAAIRSSMQFLEDQGFRVTTLPVDRFGRISPEDLRNALDRDTILVSVMYVNNEVGTIEPVEECAQIVKAFDPSVIFHTDAVQAYGKVLLRPAKTGIDLLSVSGHKLHGPKGTGFLYIREKTKIHPYIYGGGQQRGMRSGTDNVPGAAGLAAACKSADADLEKNRAHMRSLQKLLTSGLEKMEQVVIHTPVQDEDQCAPHIVNASFIGVRSEVLLHALEEEGIYVSAGSACSSNKRLPVSPVLEKMGLPREEAESALRFSFSELNTTQEVEICLETLEKLVPMLRRYSRR